MADLEYLFTHLERQVADQSRVALEQQARIEALEKQLRALQQAHIPAVESPPDDE